MQRKLAFVLKLVTLSPWKYFNTFFVLPSFYSPFTIKYKNSYEKCCYNEKKSTALARTDKTARIFFNWTRMTDSGLSAKKEEGTTYATSRVHR